MVSCVRGQSRGCFAILSRGVKDAVPGVAILGRRKRACLWIEDGVGFNGGGVSNGWRLLRLRVPGGMCSGHKGFGCGRDRSLIGARLGSEAGDSDSPVWAGLKSCFPLGF